MNFRKQHSTLLWQQKTVSAPCGNLSYQGFKCQRMLLSFRVLKQSNSAWTNLSIHTVPRRDSFCLGVCCSLAMKKYKVEKNLIALTSFMWDPTPQASCKLQFGHPLCLIFIVSRPGLSDLCYVWLDRSSWTSLGSDLSPYLCVVISRLSIDLFTLTTTALLNLFGEYGAVLLMERKVLYQPCGYIWRQPIISVESIL